MKFLDFIDLMLEDKRFSSGRLEIVLETKIKGRLILKAFDSKDDLIIEFSLES